MRATPPKLVTAGIHRFPAGWEWSFRDHPLPWRGYLLGSVLEGAGELVDEAPAVRRVALSRGMCYWLPVTEPTHRLRNTGRGVLVLAWMHVEFAGGCEVELPLDLRPRHFAFWEQLIHRAIESRQRGQEAIADAWLGAALAELTGDAATPWIADESGETRAGEIFELSRRIRLAPGEGWSVLRMAREVGLREAQFARVFRAQMGRRPHEFVVAVRIEAARAYLESTDYAVARIAELLGYADAFVFSRQFKRETGCSPSEHRVRARRREVCRPAAAKGASGESKGWAGAPFRGSVC